MVRILIVLLLTLPVAGIAAPVPRNFQKPVLYFPTTVGTKWVYDRDGIERVEEVVKVGKMEGKFEVTVVNREGKKVLSTWTYLVSEQGLSFGEDDINRPTSPNVLLKLPAKPGDQWDELGVQSKTVHTVKLIEEIEVPAGKFRTVKIESTIFQGMGDYIGPTAEWATWYAIDVGEVKYQFRAGPIAKTTVLKSFTPVKK